MLRFVREFYDFARSRAPPAPYAGDAAVVTVADWMGIRAIRGKSVPAMDLYCLRVFAESLWGSDAL